MNGKDGKPFKTRDGGVMRLEKLISEVSDKVYQRVIANKKIREEEAKEISDKVGLVALNMEIYLIRYQKTIYLM